MIVRKLFALSALLAAASFGSVAEAAPTITGTLSFVAPGGTNYFDGTLFNPFIVPTTYGNATGPAVAIGSGVEFGYIASPFASPPNQKDTADFTDTTLTIQDAIGSQPGTSNFYMTFTSNIAGFFNGIQMTGNTFGGTFSVAGDTFTFSAPATSLTNITQTATFTFAGGAPSVPEPASWAIMLGGFGLVGAMLRRRNVRFA